MVEADFVILRFRSILTPLQDAKPLDSLSAEEARTIFAAIDTDKSGEITIDELREYMRREDPSVTEEQVQRRYVYLNADGQGTLTAEDFAERHVCDKKPPAVELHGYYAFAVVQKLQSTSWKELRMIITPDVLGLGPAEGEGYDDVTTEQAKQILEYLTTTLGA